MHLLSTILSVAAATGRAVVIFCKGRFSLCSCSTTSSRNPASAIRRMYNQLASLVGVLEGRLAHS